MIGMLSIVMLSYTPQSRKYSRELEEFAHRVGFCENFHIATTPNSSFPPVRPIIAMKGWRQSEDARLMGPPEQTGP
jgi:hypothetical protein